MANFRVMVGVKLDTKSLTALKNQIKSSNAQISVDAKLDKKTIGTLKTQIGSTKGAKISVDAKLDRKTLNVLKSQIGAVKGAKIPVGVKLDPKSIASLKSRINSVKGAKANIDVNEKSSTSKINTVKKQIDSIKTQKVNLNLNTESAKKKIATIKRQINALDNTKVNVVLNAKDAAAKEAEQKINRLKNTADNIKFKVDTSSFAAQMQNIEQRAKRLVSENTEAAASVNKLRSAYSSLTNAAHAYDGSEASVNRLISANNQYYTALTRVRNQLQMISQATHSQANSIKFKIDTLSFDNDIDKIEKKFRSTGVASEQAEQKIKELKQALNGLKSASAAYKPGDQASVDRLTKAYDKYRVAVQRAQNQIAMSTRGAVDPIAKMNLTNKIELWMSQNTAAAKKFGAQLTILKSQIEKCNTATGLKRLNGQFNQLTNQAKMMNKTGMTWTERMSNQFNKFTAYMGISSIFYGATMAIRRMFTAVKEVDTAMTELKRVSDLSSTGYANLFDNMTESAKNYGVALSDLINSTANWTKQGFDTGTANKLAEVSTMYQHIGTLEVKEADENLITAYNGFKNQLLNMFGGDEVAAVSYAADIFNELGKVKLPMKNYIG